MHSYKIKPMVESGILTAISVAMALISMYVPILGTVVVFIWPLPIVVLVVRHGIRWGVMASIVSGLLIAMLTHPFQAISMVLAFCLVGLVLGCNFRRGCGAVKSLALAMSASVVSKVAVLGLGALLLQVNPVSMQFDMMQTAVDNSLSLYRSAGMNEADIAKTAESLRQGFETLRLVFPIIIVFAGMLDAYVNFIVAGKVLRRLGHTGVPELTPYARWRFPWIVVYLYAFSWIGIYWGQTREIALLFQVSMNVNMLSTVLGLIQGIAVIVCLTERYRLSKLVRAIILLVILTNGFLLQTIGLVGLFDIMFDYRRRLLSRK